jgi:hypothetical protein
VSIGIRIGPLDAFTLRPPVEPEHPHVWHVTLGAGGTPLPPALQRTGNFHPPSSHLALSHLARSHLADSHLARSHLALSHLAVLRAAAESRIVNGWASTAQVRIRASTHVPYP